MSRLHKNDVNGTNVAVSAPWRRLIRVYASRFERQLEKPEPRRAAGRRRRGAWYDRFFLPVPRMKTGGGTPDQYRGRDPGSIPGEGPRINTGGGTPDQYRGRDPGSIPGEGPRINRGPARC